VYCHQDADITEYQGLLRNGFFDLSYYKEFDDNDDGNRILSILKNEGDSRFSALQKFRAEEFDRGKQSA